MLFNEDFDLADPYIFCKYSCDFICRQAQLLGTSYDECIKECKKEKQECDIEFDDEKEENPYEECTEIGYTLFCDRDLMG